MVTRSYSSCDLFDVMLRDDGSQEKQVSIHYIFIYFLQYTLTIYFTLTLPLLYPYSTLTLPLLYPYSLPLPYLLNSTLVHLRPYYLYYRSRSTFCVFPISYWQQKKATMTPVTISAATMWNEESCRPRPRGKIPMSGSAAESLSIIKTVNR